MSICAHRILFEALLVRLGLLKEFSEFILDLALHKPGSQKQEVHFLLYPQWNLCDSN
jgi:hypothetical protein